MMGIERKDKLIQVNPLQFLQLRCGVTWTWTIWDTDYMGRNVPLSQQSYIGNRQTNDTQTE